MHLFYIQGEKVQACLTAKPGDLLKILFVRLWLQLRGLPRRLKQHYIDVPDNLQTALLVQYTAANQYRPDLYYSVRFHGQFRIRLYR